MTLFFNPDLIIMEDRGSPELFICGCPVQSIKEVNCCGRQNTSKEKNADMQDVNQASWIEVNVEAIERYSMGDREREDQPGAERILRARASIP